MMQLSKMLNAVNAMVKPAPAKREFIQIWFNPGIKEKHLYDRFGSDG